MQALAGEVGMDNELDEVARSLFNGQLPPSWRKLAPATLKSLGSWMEYFLNRNDQYTKWVCILVSFLNNLPTGSVLFIEFYFYFIHKVYSLIHLCLQGKFKFCSAFYVRPSVMQEKQSKSK